MNIRATSTFSPGNLAKLEALIVPLLIRATEGACAWVSNEAQELVPVDTGELQQSIGYVVEWVGQQVKGYVMATAPHAAYVEFGTGIRGAASPGAGPYPYSATWPGMPAQPYLRPALDTSRPTIIDLYRGEGFTVL